MSLIERVRSAAAVVPSSPRRVPGWVRVAAVPLAVAAVGLGVWVTGAVLSQDAAVAMLLTGAWFGVATGAALLVGLRWRALAVPVVAATVATSLAVGGYLLFTSNVDRVVHEDVVAVSDGPSGPTGATVVAAGAFRSGAHETTGRASVIRVPGGGRVLTLTGFETDPGPDLRVYLVPGDGSDVDGAVDLGRLKGNKGDQQYDVPAAAPEGAVVIWCRAFSVGFGTAPLTV
ncbi:MAG: DM13 domain-containing protein [Actinomycetes bacterium]